MSDYWTLKLEANDAHCLRLSHPHGALLRCWHGQHTYVMLGSRCASELLSLDDLLSGRTTRLCKNEVCELLLLAARTALDLDNHARLFDDQRKSRHSAQSG